MNRNDFFILTEGKMGRQCIVWTNDGNCYSGTFKQISTHEDFGIELTMCLLMDIQTKQKYACVGDIDGNKIGSDICIQISSIVKIDWSEE